MTGSGTEAIEPDLSWTMKRTGSSVQGAAAAVAEAARLIRTARRADMTCYLEWAGRVSESPESTQMFS